MYNIDGRVAVVTGGGSGIGRAIAMRLAEEGCDLALLDIDGATAEQTAAAAAKLGRRTHAAAVDVTDAAALAEFTAAAADRLGPADVLVNSAGIIGVGRILDTTSQDWQRVIRVNLDGVFNCCQAVVPQMVARGRGRVINIASWLGKKAVPYYGAYCASKFAVIGLTQTLALELAADGVMVNAICPGLIVETGMREVAESAHTRLGLPLAAERVATIPVGRTGLPDDITRLAAFLASDESEYMTGQAINVTGGLWLS